MRHVRVIPGAGTAESSALLNGVGARTAVVSRYAADAVGHQRAEPFGFEYLAAELCHPGAEPRLSG